MVVRMSSATFRSAVLVSRKACSQIFSHSFKIVPLFWTQSGYGLKPPPQLSTERTPSQIMDVLARHFARNLATYGPLVRFPLLGLLNVFKCNSQAVVNLAEQHGKEGAITAAFRERMGDLRSSDIQ